MRSAENGRASTGSAFLANLPEFQPMKILRFTFIGLLAGFILTVLADRSVWLEMRINTGLLLPVVTAAAVAAGILLTRRIPVPFILGLEIILVLLLLATYGFDLQALLIIPASSFREGFFLHGQDLQTINGILAALFFFGNGLLFLPPSVHSRPRRSD